MPKELLAMGEGDLRYLHMISFPKSPISDESRHLLGSFLTETLAADAVIYLFRPLFFYRWLAANAAA